MEHGYNDNTLCEEASFHDALYSQNRIDQETIQRMLSYDSPTENYGRRVPRLAARIRESLGDIHGKRMLVYGCGGDNAALWLAARGATVDAIDISGRAVSIQQGTAKLAGLRLNALVMDGNKLEYPDETFDCVFGNAILHHLDLERACAEIKRVLKPGGRAVFRDNLEGNLFLRIFRRATPHLRTSDEHPLTKRDVVLFSQVFDEVDVSYYMLSVLPYRFVVQTLNASVLKRLGVKVRFPHLDGVYKVLDYVDRAMFAIIPPLKMQAWQCVVVMTKGCDQAVSK